MQKRLIRVDLYPPSPSFYPSSPRNWIQPPHIFCDAASTICVVVLSSKYRALDPLSRFPLPLNSPSARHCIHLDGGHSRAAIRPALRGERLFHDAGALLLSPVGHRTGEGGHRSAPGPSVANASSSTGRSSNTSSSSSSRNNTQKGARSRSRVNTQLTSRNIKIVPAKTGTAVPHLQNKTPDPHTEPPQPPPPLGLLLLQKQNKSARHSRLFER